MVIAELIKKIDRIIGPVLLRLFPKPRGYRFQAKQLKRVLVIRPGGMGDALLLLPSIKKIYQDQHVTVDILCEPRNRAVFESCPFANKIYSYQNPVSFLSIFSKRYDAVIDTEQSHFLSAVTARLIRTPVRLGFNTFNREVMLTHSIKYRTGYEAEVFWHLFSALFRINAPFSFSFPYLKGSIKKRHLYAGYKHMICIFPGATTHERHWPEQRWAQICDWIVSKGKTPILLGGGMEIQSCRKIIFYCKNPGTVNLAGRLSIAQTIDLFSKAKKIVSTDSGILHLGVLCGLPTVSLFGPSDPEKWGPKGPNDKILSYTGDCSPCASFGTIPKCVNNLICMKKIAVSAVIQALDAENDQGNNPSPE